MNFILCILYGPYSMVPYNMVYSIVSMVPDFRLVCGMITLPSISIIWANKVWLYVGTHSKSIVASAFPGMKTLVVLQRKPSIMLLKISFKLTLAWSVVLESGWSYWIVGSVTRREFSEIDFWNRQRNILWCLMTHSVNKND